jgi:hypothetical protein
MFLGYLNLKLSVLWSVAESTIQGPYEVLVAFRPSNDDISWALAIAIAGFEDTMKVTLAPRNRDHFRQQSLFCQSLGCTPRFNILRGL